MIPGIMNVITNTSAVITTPGYPSAYPENVKECWMRTPSCGHHVQLEFLEFNVSVLFFYKIKYMHFQNWYIFKAKSLN